MRPPGGGPLIGSHLGTGEDPAQHQGSLSSLRPVQPGFSQTQIHQLERQIYGHSKASSVCS